MELTPARAVNRRRYQAKDTVARSTLVGRGWTAAHIKRLLEGCDEATTGGQAAKYDRASVDAAERTDPELQQRLTRIRNRREAKQSRAVSRRVDDGQVVWRRREGRWVLFGRDLREGQSVDATRRGGRVERKRVTKLLEVTPAGTYAEAGRFPTRRRPPRDPSIRQVLLAGEYPSGAIVSIDGEQVELLVVRSVTINAGDPARWGAHLAGHIGQVGTRATCRASASTGG